MCVSHKIKIPQISTLDRDAGRTYAARNEKKRVRTVLYCTLKTWKVSPPFSRSRTAGPAAAYQAMFSVLQHPAPRTQNCSFCLCCCVLFVTLNIVRPKLGEGKARFLIRFVEDLPTRRVFGRFVSLTSANELVIQVFQIGRDLRWFSLQLSCQKHCQNQRREFPEPDELNVV